MKTDEDRWRKMEKMQKLLEVKFSWHALNILCPVRTIPSTLGRHVHQGCSKRSASNEQKISKSASRLYALYSLSTFLAPIDVTSRFNLLAPVNSWTNTSTYWKNSYHSGAKPYWISWDWITSCLKSLPLHKLREKIRLQIAIKDRGQNRCHTWSSKCKQQFQDFTSCKLVVDLISGKNTAETSAKHKQKLAWILDGSIGSKTLSFKQFHVVSLHRRAKRIPSALMYFFRPNCPSERQYEEFDQCSEQPPSHQAQAQAACKLGYFKWLTHKRLVIHVLKSNILTFLTQHQS